MKVLEISLVVLAVILVVGADSDGDSGTQKRSLTKLTYDRWINLLRYVYKTSQREVRANHTIFTDRAAHVRLIAESIDRHFFNDVFKLVQTEDGYKLHAERFPVDFLIVLDSSASIGTDNFNKAIRILTTWVGLLDEEYFISGNLRVGMISFSEPDKVIHEFSFTTYANKSDVINHISSTEYHAGKSTSTAQALWMADYIFGKHSRADVTRVMLMCTDGWSHNELQLPFGVVWPSARLRINHNVQVFVAAIGDQYNHNELEAIASKPEEDHLFEVEDYDMMLEVLDYLTNLHDTSDS